MKTVTINRRQMLRGAGGVAVGLPFLPSLVPVKAYAANVAFARVPRFVAITTEHGGISWPNMFPSSAALTNSQEILPGFTARWGALKATFEGNDAVLSPVLRAPATLLTPRIASRMNVLRGLDIPMYMAHQSGAHLGNYSASGGESQTLRNLPTIDQVMAYSSSFYPTLDGIRERVLYHAGKYGLSYNFSVPSKRTGGVQATRPVYSAKTLFEQVFPPPSALAPLGTTPIVDRVLERYRSLRNSNSRLSSGDRQRLDDHIERLADLERKLRARSSSSCSVTPTLPNDGVGTQSTRARPDLMVKQYAAITEVVAMAFACGVTRVALIGITDTFSEAAGDWHQDYAHQWHIPVKQQALAAAVQRVFQSVVLELARKLDVEEAAGVTYLDNTLVQWTQECGWATHDNWSMPVVTVGGAAGALKTGRFCDYQNQNPRALLIAGAASQTRYGGQPIHSGLTYNRWLGTALQAMGVKPEEYAQEGMFGYAQHYPNAKFSKTWVPGVAESANAPLPFLT